MGMAETDIAVFRPSDGVWYIIRAVTEPALITSWGLNGDVPVAGDYDGDGRDDIAVYRPTERDLVSIEQFERCGVSLQTLGTER